MTGVVPARWPVAAALVLALADPFVAAAQQLPGVALGPDGEPLEGISVVLHRVGGGGGAFVGADITDEEGGFRFDVRPDSAVYFAALRYDGRLYIGPATQAGGEPVSGYILRVDPASEVGAVATALSGATPAPGAARPAQRGRTGARGGGDAGAFLLVGLLALTAVLGFLYAAPRYRRHRTLDAVIELAEIENELARSPATGERGRLEADRERLRKQLAPGA